MKASIQTLKLVACTIMLGIFVGPVLAQSTSSWLAGPLAQKKKIESGATPPVVLHSEALKVADRRLDVRGVITMRLVIQENGLANHVRIVRNLGFGLDEAAVEAVRLYRFRPAMEHGKPVAIETYLDICVDTFGDTCQDKASQAH